VLVVPRRGAYAPRMFVESSSTPSPVNVAQRLAESARRQPRQLAVVAPAGSRNGKRIYRSLTFQELDEESNRLASGLLAHGVPPGSRLILLVPPSLEFISLVFALFRAGMITVLIDPGMGRRNLVRCLSECQPEGFVGIPLAQAIRTLLASRFPDARHNITVGRRWFWGGPRLDDLRELGSPAPIPLTTEANDPAAIIFTTGSTGPPKGVLYTHGNFDQQVEEIRDRYQIAPGEVDLPGFPLFGLFNSAMGVTTVIPDMDPTRPARVDPRRIIEAVNDWRVTQAFGSPAMWNTVGRFCEREKVQLGSLRRVLSAGAPVPPHVLKRMRDAISPEGEIHTPYGATEALPVASIDATTVLGETAARSAEGRGTCVGTRFPGIEWRVIRIDDGPIATIDQAEILKTGEIGELMVRGGVVTQGYVTRPEANALHKVTDGPSTWHRMGDVGYLDEQDRFWFCGRKSHRVQTRSMVMYTIPCEAIFNQHPHVYRSALVGVGPAGSSRPVIFVEPWPEHWPRSSQNRRRLKEELLELAGSRPITSPIQDVVFWKSLPVDIRHNAKIFREKLAAWAARRFN
jgi:olefin beta-lactone synthetase